MNILLFLLLSFVSSLFDPGEKEKWLVQKSSNLSISGKSNISSFTCEIPGTNSTDTLTIDYDDDGGNITFVKKQLRINTTNADCGNPLVTNDFRETLKSDKYPDVILNFLSLERPQFRDFSAMTVKGSIEIIIAGTSRSYDVSYQIKPYTTGRIEFIGSQTMSLSDFNLKPPTRLLGLLKVEEEIKVNFHLQLTPIL